MKKRRVLLNMINDSITFSFEYYTFLEAFLSPISLKPKKTKTIVEVRQLDIISNRILEKSFDENLDDFLRTI